MSTIVKILRIIGFYIGFFVACTIFAAIALDSLSDGFVALFVLLAPLLLVWWYEKHRAARTMERRAFIKEVSPAVPSSPKRTLDIDADTIRRFQSDLGKIAHPAAGAVRQSTEALRASGIRDKSFAQSRVPREDPSIRRKGHHQGWVPKGEVVTIAGRQIGGMVYVGVPPHIKSSYYGERCRAYIDPAQHVAQFGSDKNGEKLPYWPSYADIPSVCRATYLDWLASGREDASIDPGYMFLFFYGLERRFMLDDASLEEKQEIVDEVARLKAVFHESHSVQRYLGDFLDIARVTAMNGATSDDPALRQSILENHNWEVPTTLKVLLGGLIAEDKPLDAELLRLWFVCDPQASLRTPGRRCGPEFAALFDQKFNARYPDGLKVRTPKRSLKISYRAASHEFEATIAPTLGENGNTAIPDISTLRSPIAKAQAIADEAMDELEKFSRYLGRNAEGRGTIEAQTLLPASLWSLFPSEELEQLKTWARGKVTAGSLVPALDVVERLEGVRPDKLGKRHLTGAADALGRIGIGMAPDPRFSLRGPKADEPVVLFKLEEPVEQLEEVSPAYREQLFEIALATLVAHSDAKIVEAERTALRDKIAHAPGLTALERIRLEANLAWYLEVPPDLSWLRSRLKKADAEHHLALRAAVVAIAHADSVIQSEEVACIEKVYQALGIDAGLVYADLHAGGAMTDAAGGPVRVKPAEDGAPGEAIPAEPVAKTQPLDAERIAAIRSDTARVSSVLGEIFATDEDEGEEAIDAQPVSLSLAGLEVKQALLVKQIVTREHWTTEDFDQLAEAQGLLPTGALEAINEWAFDRFDEALLDEYDGYDVSPLIAEALKAERAEGESGNVEVEAARA